MTNIFEYLNLNELKYNAFLRKQKSVTKLFPTFYNRVKKVEEKGGIRLVTQLPELWQFKVHSGTKEGVTYDVYVKFQNVLEVLKKYVVDQRLWNKEKTAVDYKKLSAEIMNNLDLESDCSCPADCLVADTKIPLLNGKTLTIAELLQEYDKDKEFWVYSVNEKGNFIPGKAKHLGIIGQVDKLIKITLDNDKYFECTPNHLIMLRNGIYKKASELIINESLMPLNNVRMQVYQKEYHQSNKEKRNHKVKNIEIINLEVPVDVYDIFVEDSNNFLLECGNIVHNSFYGDEYMKTQRGAQFGDQENRPPRVKNPRQYGLICKHSQLVFDALPIYVTTFASFLKKFWKKDIEEIVSNIVVKEVPKTTVSKEKPEVIIPGEEPEVVTPEREPEVKTSKIPVGGKDEEPEIITPKELVKAKKEIGKMITPKAVKKEPTVKPVIPTSMRKTADQIKQAAKKMDKVTEPEKISKEEMETILKKLQKSKDPKEQLKLRKQLQKFMEI